MSVAVTTAVLALIDGATALTVKSGERRLVDSQAAEPARPYVRVSFTRLAQRTKIPGRKRGLALIEIFAASGVDAWYHGEALADALGLSGVACAPSRPNPIDTYEMFTPLDKGDDPGGGAVVQTSLAFHYY